MFHQTDVETLSPGLTPFPRDVFASDQPWLSDHLLPLLSIDLGVLKPELAGTVVHMLCPVEPYDGNIGGGTEHFHNAFTSTGWFALRLTEDNRYRFLGQEGYFRLSPQRDFDLYPGEEEHAAQMKESYAKARAYFEKHGRLGSYSAYGKGEAQEHAWLDSLGGDFWGGNWTDPADVPSAFTLTDDWNAEQITLTYEGKPFFPVAHVAGYHWCASGADAILLFYEPESRTALFTFDWR